ncbi:craniofacial development protein 1 isoform X2 [Hemicordylus capensis]|uniref:craniofacial development protein 1 isoform X2 n=1 Tax=Hemicordylus capensis TaxID=884348 RepID=UPI002304AA99|nr:craniofacial development protein 1 isoform X2 [Hemicordylus capensis]
MVAASLPEALPVEGAGAASSHVGLGGVFVVGGGRGLLALRKRNKGGGWLEPGGGEASKEEDSDSEGGESGGHPTQTDAPEKKKEEDALWASFLSDVGQKPKATAPPQGTRTLKDKPAEEKDSRKPQEMAKDPQKPKVAITKVFDFAGEEVRVTKEVDAASEEAQLFLKQQGQKPVGPAPHPTGSGVKRPSGMSSLLGKIGAKKQKLSTLEKSKLDWETFKEEEGIGEELATHNRGKEGYLERKAFLERVDHRQFEIERDIRLSSMKP